MAVILAREPVTMIWDALKSLVLTAPKQEVIDQIRSVAADTLNEFDFDIDFLDVVKTGRKVWIDIYIVHKDDMISVKDLRKAHDRITAVLKSEYDDIFVELIPELNPGEDDI